MFPAEGLEIQTESFIKQGNSYVTTRQYSDLKDPKERWYKEEEEQRRERREQEKSLFIWIYSLPNTELAMAMCVSTSLSILDIPGKYTAKFSSLWEYSH
ncbi:uncharacterized protein ACOB8E_003331 isoform 2-T2 [Sarcophilus harrisii]